MGSGDQSSVDEERRKEKNEFNVNCEQDYLTQGIAMMANKRNKVTVIDLRRHKS